MRILLFLLFSCFIQLNLQGQITLEAQHAPAVGDIFINYVDSLLDPSIIITAPGPNQTWDFSSLSKLDSIKDAVILPENAFGGDAFPAATMALTNDADVSTQFAIENSSEITGIGQVLPNPFTGELLTVGLDPTQTFFKIPTNYLDSYVDDWGFLLGLPSFIDGVDSIRVTFDADSHVNIDAWGTVQLPNGDFEVLRERDSTITIINIEGLVGGFLWLPVQSDTMTQVTYNFLSRETKGDLVSLIQDGNGGVSQALWVDLSNEVVLLPDADFTFVDQGIPQDRLFAFTDQSTNEPTSWQWNFGDGNTAFGQNPIHQFSENGAYEVCLIASNLAGANMECKTVTVDVQDLPVAAFSYTGDLIGTFAFLDESLNEPFSWEWDLGDGTTSALQNPTHQYSMEDDYTVCLTVTNNAGSDQTCETVTVTFQTAPIADFIFDHTSDYYEFVFTDQSQNNPDSWLWDFGDGETSTVQNPVHVFQYADLFNVCLSVWNSAGMHQICKEVPVVVPATALPWEAHWELSPNPTSDYIYLSLDNSLTGSKIEIYSAIGEKVFEASYNGGQQIDLQNFAIGMYVLKIVQDKKIIGAAKIVRQ